MHNLRTISQTIEPQTAITNSSRQAKFTMSSTRGTYTLTVTNVSKSGYTFDAAGSVLSKSVTK